MGAPFNEDLCADLPHRGRLAVELFAQLALTPARNLSTSLRSDSYCCDSSWADFNTSSADLPVASEAWLTLRYCY